MIKPKQQQILNTIFYFMHNQSRFDDLELDVQNLYIDQKWCRWKCWAQSLRVSGSTAVQSIVSGDEGQKKKLDGSLWWAIYCWN